MSNTKHTPGPWTKCFLNGHWHIARKDGRVEIAKVAAYKNREQSTANARLIAAAPELLEACHNALAWLGEKPEPNDDRPHSNSVRALIDQLEAAIAKATSL